MYAMAKGLWDKNSSFEDICEEYFTAAFREDGEIVEKYLSTLSELFDPAYFRGEKEVNSVYIEQNLLRAKEVIAEFVKAVLSEKAEKNVSWKYLKHHAELVDEYANVLMAYVGTKVTDEGKQQALFRLQKMMNEKEPVLHTVFDPTIFQTVYSRYLGNFE